MTSIAIIVMREGNAPSPGSGLPGGTGHWPGIRRLPPLCAKHRASHPG